MITVLLIALISHLVGDFMLQTDNIAKGRDSYGYKGIKRITRSIIFNLIHGITHGIILYILIYLVNFLCKTNFNISVGLILLISLVHFFIDILKPILVSLPLKLSLIMNKFFIFMRLGSYNLKPNRDKICFVVFIIDQLLHLSSIFIIFKSLFRISPNTIYDFIMYLPDTPKIHDRILVIILILIFSTFGAAYFSKSLLDSLKNDSNDIIDNVVTVLTKEKSSKEEARNGGFTIGILERIFIILGIVMNHPTVIPIVLTVKSIARYKKFNNDSFVEYYIIGTFFSFVIAILGGAMIVKII